MHLFSSLPFPPPPPSRSLPPHARIFPTAKSCRIINILYRPWLQRKNLASLRTAISSILCTYTMLIVTVFQIFSIIRKFWERELVSALSRKLLQYIFFIFPRFPHWKLLLVSFFFFLYNKNLCRMKIVFDKYVWFLSLGSGNWLIQQQYDYGIIIL